MCKRSCADNFSKPSVLRVLAQKGTWINLWSDFLLFPVYK